MRHIVVKIVSGRDGIKSKVLQYCRSNCSSGIIDECDTIVISLV